MACDAEVCRFQMLNDDEIVTSMQESDSVDDETDEDEKKTTTKVAKVHQILTRFLRKLWSGTNNRVLSYSTIGTQKSQRPCSKAVKKRSRAIEQRKISDYFPQ
ncbi:hypothetical protein TNCV_1209721 [Trichonephila clavipes]|nr:hypothetical protein TNCV_1209721 [Trichonephila clavipes]